MKITVLLAAMTIAIGVAACSKQATPAQQEAALAKTEAEAQKDVADARASAADKVADATSAAAADANSVAHTEAQAREDVAFAAANGRYKVAVEQCETLTGDERSRCKMQAQADLDAAKALARQHEAATDPKS